MTTVASILLTIAVFFAQGPAFAHSDHVHGPDVTKEQAQKTATEAVTKLVAEKKLEESWQGVVADQAEQRTFGKAKEWVVIFKNAKAADAARRTLYVFLSLDGRVLASNFTGK